MEVATTGVQIKIEKEGSDKDLYIDEGWFAEFEKLGYKKVKNYESRNKSSN